MYYISCIVHHTSCIKNHASCIMHHASCIMHEKKIHHPSQRNNVKNINTQKQHAHAGVAYSACIIPPLRHFFTIFSHLFTTCSQLVHDLFRTCSQLFHNLFMTCHSKLLHQKSLLQILQVVYIVKSQSKLTRGAIKIENRENLGQCPNQG